MEDFNYRILLLDGYYQNDLGIDFLIQKQKERKIEKIYFVEALRNAVVQWNGIINEAFSKSPNALIANDYAIPLVSYTNSKYTNSLFKSEINFLWHFVQHLEDKLIPEKFRYVVSSFYAELSQNIEFQNSQRIHNIHGFVPIVSNDKRYKVYTAELATLLYTSKLEIALNNDIFDMPKNSLVYPIFEWFDIYKTAYVEGETYFKENYNIGPSGIYGTQSKEYIRNLHLQYYHAKIDGQINRGWQFVKNEYPTIITYEVLKRFGYYAGVLSKFSELVELHSALFKDFDKCELFDKKVIEKGLTNFQKALIHHVLVETKIEPLIKGRAIANKYGSKSIETIYNDIANKRIGVNKKGYVNDYKIVCQELEDRPIALEYLKKHFKPLE